MPITKSAFKNLKKSKKNALRNHHVKEGVKFLYKRTIKYLEKKDAVLAKEFLNKTIKALDGAVQKGVLKLNTASRKKSRLMKWYHTAMKGGNNVEKKTLK